MRINNKTRKECNLPNDAVGSNELQLVVRGLEDCFARGVGRDVAEIAGVTDLGGGSAVGQAVGVIVATGGQAAVGVVAKLAVLRRENKEERGEDCQVGDLLVNEQRRWCWC